MSDFVSHFRMPDQAAFCTWCVYNQMFICHADVDVLGLMDGTPRTPQAKSPAEKTPLLHCVEYRPLLASKPPKLYWLSSRTSPDATTA